MDTKKNMSREQLLAYMRDNCTEAEAQQVRMWLRERLKDPGLDQLFSDLLDATETEYDPEGKERVRRKLDSILAACPAPNSPPRSGNLRRWRWSLRIIEYAAAVAAVVLALHYRHQANTPREWVEVYAGMGERREIVLPDSTHVWLNAGTKLIYPKQFNRSMRQVYLSGEMFADVRRDEDRPFIVSADRLEVKVLGTQFNLKSYQEDAKSEVSLVRGKVSVGIKASKMNGKLTLEPGDILRFNKTNNHIDFLNSIPIPMRTGSTTTTSSSWSRPWATSSPTCAATSPSRSSSRTNRCATRPTTPRSSTRSRSTKSSMRSTRIAFSRCAGKPRYITYRHP